ncbi:hypothetical protein [Marinospirillum alkaliphilum]|uniref:Uncharacterized protein n=1 Tax=Marinospirillum alkaliphilum DSM 21637 TaxID=1122209 RepID=A0A1K1VIM5_9GAMM|nr:hypothetical protein [Marinospirillum alkaliphilum]SFX24911.1 hypothetical protein SAMN02745752_01006 [Marinospirillum alkaliphilum DSM 21637]
MKNPAIISTLLDRQAILLDAVFNEQPMDIITPKLFYQTAISITRKHKTKSHIIEEKSLTSKEIKELAKHYNNNIEIKSDEIDKIIGIEKNKAVTKTILEAAKKRTEKIIAIYSGLDKLNEELDIKALIVNQEYMIHEATLLSWAKSRNIPCLHSCHSPYIARNLGRIRHFESDHLTLTSSRCNETLDDLNTGSGHRHVTGMVNWDTYRDIDLQSLNQLRNDLEIPSDALVITFFTTYSVTENATSDPQVHSKTLDSFLSAAAEIKKKAVRPLFFIIKDRPSGTHFTEEEVLHKARKLGITDGFSYVFDRPEKVVLISDITISPGSSIAVESMAMGKATIELVTRQVFLGQLCFSADDGVIQCDERTLKSTLERLIVDNNYRDQMADKAFENEYYVSATQSLEATQKTASLILDICGFKDSSDRVIHNQNFYDQISSTGSDQRFQQVDTFQIWSNRTRPDEFSGQLMGERYNQWRAHPRFHLVIITDKSLFDALANTLDSFEMQIYPHYGISIISPDDCPDDILSADNIQWIKHAQPFEAINTVIDDVDAEWVMILWPGDELHPQALFNIADYSNINTDWLAIYGDEALIIPTMEDLDDDQTRLGTSIRTDPIFKPDFNIDLLRSTDYINRATAFRKDAWTAMGGLSPYAYRQSEDLIFRIAERMTLPAIGHIPNILVQRSSFTDNMVSSESYEALGALIRKNHLERCGFTDAEVLPGLHPQIYNIKYNQVCADPVIDILLANFGLSDQLSSCLSSLLEQENSKNLTIYITSTFEVSDAQDWLISHEIYSEKIKWVKVPLSDQTSIIKQWSKMIDASQSEFFILAIDRLRWVQKNWHLPLIDQLQRSDIAMVAPRLVSSNAAIISAGQILGKNGLIGDLYSNFFLEQEIPGLPRAWCEQNFNALHAACIAVKRSIYQQLGGFDPLFEGLLAMNDLQLKACTSGHKLLWTPLCSVVLTQSLAPAKKDDRRSFMSRWFALLAQDPAFNNNLELRGSGVNPDIILSGKWHSAYHLRTRVLFCYLDVSNSQVQSSAHLIKALQQESKKESIQHQEHHFYANATATAITSTELSRLSPDICIYLGDVVRHSELIEEISSYTTIQQWVILTSLDDFEKWQVVQNYITGWLVTSTDTLAELPELTSFHLLSNPDEAAVYFQMLSTTENF